MYLKNQLPNVLNISLAILLLVGLPLGVMGQNQHVSINVAAEVSSSIELVTLRSMQLSGAEAENNIIRIDPTSSPNAGKMVAFGNPNSDIRISYLQVRELSNDGGAETLTFNYQVSGNQQEDQTTSELLGIENRDFTFNQDGEFYIWIGGNVDLSAVSPGNYQGEFTLEIEYI